MIVNTHRPLSKAAYGLRRFLLINRCCGLLPMLVSVLIFCCAHNAGAAILHVGADWSGTKYATIQAAVDAASAGDEIWVEQGTYTLAATVTITKSLALYGGFTGSETSRDQRDWTANVTTVDGNNSVRCFQLQQITSTGAVTIDGFTITKGTTSVNDDWPNGPAICNGTEDEVDDGGNLTVANCSILQNTSGKHGAISNEQKGNLTVDNCIFFGNTATNRGGAINHNEGAVNMTVTGCTFSGNSAKRASGIYVKCTTTGTSVISNCVFTKNTTTADGSTIVSADYNTTITGCTFAENTSANKGIFGASGANTIALINCVFTRNTAVNGGAICIQGTTAEPTPVPVYLGTVTVMNCTIADNTLAAGGNGGAIYSACRPKDDGTSVFTVTNSIIWGNSGNAIERQDTARLLPTVSYTDIDQSGYEGPISNSINKDPLFVGSGDYHLQAGSPCIDNGTASGAPDVDRDGTVRPYGNGYDLGAYEYDNSSRTAAPTCTDADGDGYGENCILGPDCNDNDSFYNKICPDSQVKIIPQSLGWFLGEKEKTRRLLVIAPRGKEFDANTGVKWETKDITVLSKNVLFKRFMFMKVDIDGAALGKGDYWMLIGTCSGKLTLVK